MTSNNPSIPTTGVDHLLYACSALDRGMDEIEALLGVRPVIGGRHPIYGTHNALLSLGPGSYLEVIARDPSLPVPAQGALVDLKAGAASRLMTWVWRVDDLTAAKALADRRNAGLGEIQSGSRRTPDGREVRWELTDPYTLPMNGVVPFLINWGETTHPSLVVPEAGRLKALTLRHPEPDRVRRLLEGLRIAVEVQGGEVAEVEAAIETSAGRVDI